MEKKKLRLWIDEFNEGRYDDDDEDIQIMAGWYDWFCNPSLLRGFTYEFGSIIRQFKDGGKVDLDKTYVFFKNSCSCDERTYSDFRICDSETHDVLFNVRVGCEWEERKYAVRRIMPAGEDGVPHLSEQPVFATDSESELVEWFNTL